MSMREQFLREWGKLAHAWSVRIVFLFFLAGAVIAAMSSDCTGYMAPFIGCSYWGNMPLILFAVIAAGQVAGEYQNGRAARAAAEIKRGRYFAAKVMGLFSLSTSLCLFYTAVLTLFCSVRNGIGSGYFSHYPLQVTVVLFCNILIYWIYMAVFFLIGVLVRRKFWAFALSFGVLVLEIFLDLRLHQINSIISVAGPWTALMEFGNYRGRANFLTYDFYLLFVPGVYAGIVALAIAYYAFRRGKMQTGSYRKTGRLFAGLGRTAQVFAAIAVIFLFSRQAVNLAAENTMSQGNQPPVENVGELRLVYGDRNLDDEDAFVLLLMAEGFTEKEQGDFFSGVDNLISRLMSISPYDEFGDVTKIYALGTISAQSGIKGDGAATWEQAKQDSRDTFFGTSFWGGGQSWKLGLSQEGDQKVCDLRRQFLPAADFCGIIVNSDVKRGTAYFHSSGNTVLTTLDTGALPHELGHAVAGLADEYDRKGYNNFYEAPNMTQESDPQRVRWAKYIGEDDISVYACTYNSRWCHPSMKCIMRASDTDRFCLVCEDALRENICKYCAGGRLLFSSLGEEIPESETGTDMREYFRVRKKFKTLESDQIPENLLILKYYDENGRVMDEVPGRAGTYFVEAQFAGYQTVNFFYDPCSLKVSYEIKLSSAKVFWLSVMPLFAGISVWIVWKLHKSKNTDEK